MKKIHLLIAIGLSFCLFSGASCDEGYSVRYSIHNETDDRVYLYFKNDTIWDTLYTSAQTELYVWWDTENRGAVEWGLENADLSFFDELVIKNADDKEFNKNTSDIENWEKGYPGSGYLGTVKLFVTNEDFQ